MWSTVTTRQSGPSVLGIRAALILSLTATLPVASAFSFAFQNTNSTLQSCQSVEVVWQGGQPPFELLIIVSLYTTYITCKATLYRIVSRDVRSRAEHE